MGDVKIHPTAIIEKGAELGSGVEIGPFSIVGENVKIGDNTKIRERVTLTGWTSIGKGCEVFSGAVIGSRTQDKKFKGEKSYVNIGDENIFREYVTVNPGTDEGTETRIGDHNLFMAYAHIAHDCIVHNHVTIANVGTLAGHVEVEDRAIIGGLSAAHQFVRIGAYSITGGCSKLTQDIPPFMMVDGHPATACSVNSVGLQRADFSAEDKSLIKKAYKILFRQKLPLKKAIIELEENLEKTERIQQLLTFLKKTERGICK